MRSEYPYQIDKICAEIIVEVMDAVRSPATVDADKLYDGLCTKFDAAIRLCEVERFSVDAMRELLYPLAAFADEMFMAMPQYRTRWIAGPLQLRYFGEVIAGTSFFSRLEKLTEAPEGKERRLELYFICLALGFKGMYATGDRSGLRTIFENLGNILAGQLAKRETPALIGRRKARGKFLSLQKSLFAAFLLFMIVTAAVYLTSLIDFLRFLEGSL